MQQTTLCFQTGILSWFGIFRELAGNTSDFYINLEIWCPWVFWCFSAFKLEYIPANCSFYIDPFSLQSHLPRKISSFSCFVRTKQPLKSIDNYTIIYYNIHNYTHQNCTTTINYPYPRFPQSSFNSGCCSSPRLLHGSPCASLLFRSLRQILQRSHHSFPALGCWRKQL